MTEYTCQLCGASHKLKHTDDLDRIARIRGSTQRAIYKSLRGKRGAYVPIADLGEEVWNGRIWPPEPNKTLGVAISALRKKLRPHGWEIVSRDERGPGAEPAWALVPTELTEKA